MNITEEIIEEMIEFYHDTTAAKHRRTRRNNAVKWRTDRNKGNKKWEFTDVALVKKQLHKQNRKDPEVTSQTYYKKITSLGSVCWART